MLQKFIVHGPYTFSGRQASQSIVAFVFMHYRFEWQWGHSELCHLSDKGNLGVILWDRVMSFCNKIPWHSGHNGWRVLQFSSKKFSCFSPKSFDGKDYMDFDLQFCTIEYLHQNFLVSLFNETFWSKKKSLSNTRLSTCNIMLFSISHLLSQAEVIYKQHLWYLAFNKLFCNLSVRSVSIINLDFPRHFPAHYVRVLR